VDNNSDIPGVKTMAINQILPFISTVVMLVFAVNVLRRYFVRRAPHNLFWGLGLLMYAAGTFAEAYLALAWSQWMLMVWYLCGAMLTAAWLGQGTVFLLIRRKEIAWGSAIGLLAVSALAVVKVLGASVDGSSFVTHTSVSAQYKLLMTRDGLLIFLTVLLNIYGSLGLIGGALWSTYLFARKHVLPNRVVGNILIATGALLPASAGTLIKFGLGDWLYVSELFGAVIMFMGFIAAGRSLPQEETAPQAVTAGAGG
jgi:hypothetical protein